MGKKTVLLVAYDEINRRLIPRQIRSSKLQDECDVLVVATVAEAREKIGTALIALVLTDWTGMKEGTAVVTDMCNSAKEKGAEILVMNGAGVDTEEAILACGFKVIEKPFTKEELITAIRSALSNNKPE